MSLQPVLSIVVPFDGMADLTVPLAALTAITADQIARYGLPALYASGVRYRTIHGAARCRSDRRESCERFLSARQLLAEKLGDCKDLAAYRAAELRLQGEDARAFVVPSPTGFHVKVRRADGSIEDPSIRLGMKGRG
jgi:hypothetical protein